VLGYFEHGYGKIASSGMLRRVALVRTDVSEKLIASIIRVTRISELGTTLAVTSGVTSQKTAFFIVTAVKTSNLTRLWKILHVKFEQIILQLSQ
jgi:hypothetical protein